jgi:hypothetical protein
MLTHEDLQRQRVAIQNTIAPRLVTEPLKSKVQAWLDAVASGNAPPAPPVFQVIIELNHDHPGPRSQARDAVKNIIRTVLQEGADAALRRNQDDATHPYIFAELTPEQILAVIEADGMAALNRDKQMKEPVAEDVPGLTDMKKPVPHRYLRIIFRMWEAQKLTP